MHKENTELKLPTKKAFEEWLKSKKPGATVGVTTRANSCPLALHIREKYDHNCNVGVTPYYIRVNSKRIRLVDNHWIERFVLNLDAGRERPAPVTREEALKALRSKPRRDNVEPR